jgi:nucleoside-diphosphate-sugar epimerase
VFHVAATVDFNENIKSAYDVNVKGTKILLEFCKKFENLKVKLIIIIPRSLSKYILVGGAHFHGVCLLSSRCS